MLTFSSSFKAIQFLSDYTGNRVIIAASLKNEMPKLIKRLMLKKPEIQTEKQAEETILSLANADPDFQGNLDKNLKNINVILEWFINNEHEIRVERKENIAKEIKKYRKLVGKGQASKKLKDFNTFGDFIEYLEEIEESLITEEKENLKREILLQPDAINEEYKAYEIDYDWDEGGAAIFEDQSKWCVNEKYHYDNYRPLYLFTKNNHYYALLSIVKDEFKDNKNDLVSEDIYYELEPLFYKLNIEDKVRQIAIMNGIVYLEYEEIMEYADSAWNEWAKEYFISELEYKFETEIKNLEKELQRKIEIKKDASDNELYDLFYEGMENAGAEWYWDDSSVSIDLYEIINSIEFKDLEKILTDPIEKKIIKDETISEEELSEYFDPERLRKKYPEYFKKLSETHGQTKLFSSFSQAIQYLSDYTGKRIKISYKKRRN